MQETNTAPYREIFTVLLRLMAFLLVIGYMAGSLPSISGFLYHSESWKDFLADVLLPILSIPLSLALYWLVFKSSPAIAKRFFPGENGGAGSPAFAAAFAVACGMCAFFLVQTGIDAVQLAGALPEGRLLSLKGFLLPYLAPLLVWGLAAWAFGLRTNAVLRLAGAPSAPNRAALARAGKLAAGAAALVGIYLLVQLLDTLPIILSGAFKTQGGGVSFGSSSGNMPGLQVTDARPQWGSFLLAFLPRLIASALLVLYGGRLSRRLVSRIGPNPDEGSAAGETMDGRALFRLALGLLAAYYILRLFLGLIMVFLMASRPSGHEANWIEIILLFAPMLLPAALFALVFRRADAVGAYALRGTETPEDGPGSRTLLGRIIAGGLFLLGLLLLVKALYAGAIYGKALIALADIDPARFPGIDASFFEHARREFRLPWGLTPTLLYLAASLALLFRKRRLQDFLCRASSPGASEAPPFQDALAALIAFTGIFFFVRAFAYFPQAFYAWTGPWDLLFKCLPRMALALVPVLFCGRIARWVLSRGDRTLSDDLGYLWNLKNGDTLFSDDRR